MALGLFVIGSAVATTVLLRRRRIPLIKLVDAETFDWRSARRVVGTLFFFTALAQAIAATPFVKGKFQLLGAPVLLWALALLYAYLWVRCIALLRRKSEA
jgi:hypothetical protein